MILALDEMSLYFQATTTHVWSPRGDTPVIAVHPGREPVHFYGAIHLRNGREIALPTSELSSERTLNFLMILLMCYPQPIFLLMERAPWHHGEVTAFVEDTDRLQVVFLPPACPDLNPQEHVWDTAREAISHNHPYRQFQPLIEDFEDYLNETLFTTHFMDTYTPLGLGVF